MSDEKTGFNYVDVVGEGFEGSINLFYDDCIIAFIRDVDLADKIRDEVVNRYDRDRGEL